MTIVASILVIVAIAGFIAALSNYGSFRGHNYRRNQYEAIVKPRSKAHHEYKHKTREVSAVTTIMDHWQKRVNRHDRKQAADTARAARAMQKGKDPSRFVQRTLRRDNDPNNPVRLRNKEVRIFTNIRRKAQEGNSRAQQLSGMVHPKTGHTTGGLGGIGHVRPSGHMPNIKQPKKKNPASRAIKSKKSISEILIGKPKSKRRR